MLGEAAFPSPSAVRVLRAVMAEDAVKVHALGPMVAWAGARLVAVDAQLLGREPHLVLSAAVSGAAVSHQVVAVTESAHTCRLELLSVRILGRPAIWHLDRRVEADIVGVELDSLGRAGLGASNGKVLVSIGSAGRSIASFVLNGDASVP